VTEETIMNRDDPTDKGIPTEETARDGRADGAEGSDAAFAEPLGNTTPPVGGYVDIRPAGPDGMRDKPRQGWDKVDESSDESLPASDPPAY
jgi:hypothetical protein